jgi:hypothetical protein
MASRTLIGLARPSAVGEREEDVEHHWREWE